LETANTAERREVFDALLPKVRISWKNGAKNIQKPGKTIGNTIGKIHKEPGFPWFSWIDVLRNMSCQMEMLAGDSSGSAVVGGAQSGGSSVRERLFYLGRTD